MEVCQVRQGAVTEEELMKRRSLLALGGIDQGTLYAHGGEAAWVSAAGVHLLRDRVFSHPGLPADGSVYGIRAADGGFLAAINGGQGEGESYQSGLVRFDAEGAEGWEYPGWLAGFAWADEVAVGYTGSRISDLPAFPRILGPGPRTGTVVGTPVADSSMLWGGLSARGTEVIAIQATEETAWVVSTDVHSGRARRVAMTGPCTSPARWYEAGDGPLAARLVDDRLLWTAEGHLWGTSVDTGKNVPQVVRHPSDQSHWFVQEDAVVMVGGTGRSYTLASRADGADWDPVRARVPGPGDQTCVGAVRLPALSTVAETGSATLSSRWRG